MANINHTRIKGMNLSAMNYVHSDSKMTGDLGFKQEHAKYLRIIEFIL